MKYDIFISYRREGGDQYARTIQQALEKTFRVFLDFDELKDGVFDQHIIDAINSSSVFLLILSKGALDRCVNEDDWVRQEILQAVKSGCHIVPVTIDDSFEGLPATLPTELVRAIGQHQFSELQMKTLFKASMEQLIKNRIAPYVHPEESVSGAEIHIETDADCDLFCFNKFICRLKAGEDNVAHLKPGKYKLEFVSTEVPEVKESMVYSLSSGISSDILEVKLRMKIMELEKRPLFCVERERKYGFIDKSGNDVIPCIWNYANDFSEGLAKVKDNGKYGYIDKFGKLVIQYNWNDAWDFREGLARIKDNGKYGYIDKFGKVVIQCNWNDAGDFREGLAWVRDGKGKYGFIDKSGKTVIPCNYSNAMDFSEGLAWVVIPCECNDVGNSIETHVKKLERNCGCIDKSGKVVIQYKWNDAWDKWNGARDFIKEKVENGKDGYIDKSKSDRDDIFGFKRRIRERMMGSILKPQLEMIGTMYLISAFISSISLKDKCFSFSEGLARIKDNGKYGYIDKFGKVVFQCNWNDAGDFREGLAWVKDDNGKYGYIDKFGKVVIQCDWNNAGDFREGLAWVKDDNGRYGFIDKSGEVVISCKWNDALFFKEGLAGVQGDNGLWYYIDKKGEVISERTSTQKYVSIR